MAETRDMETKEKITENGTVTIVQHAGQVVRSPNGTLYKILVSDEGALSTEEVPE